MQQPLMPLFPLEMVLLPGARVPLHIFEERYKEMIGEAIRNRTEFGIVLASGNGILNTGCTAVVDRVLREYDDGRLDIVATGRRRFEIFSLDQERSFLRGEVQFFDDEDQEEPAADVQARVAQDLEELESIESASDVLPPTPDMPLSFRAAQSIQDLNFRQLLLAIRSEAERIRRLAEFLPPLIARARRTAQVRAAASKNGHARHFEP